MSGPLIGVRVVEMAGLGPAPYTCMLLAEAGADVIRVARPTGRPPEDTGPHWDLLNRSRPSIAVNLKNRSGVDLVMDLVAQSEVFVEGWRPGVAERLGVGPEQCWEVSPAMVYGRMTGWGQSGPLAKTAGHDITYISRAGPLWAFGRAEERPAPPLNLVGDFGGGGMMLAFGICAALVEARASGRGQVVDAAMVDGVASLMTMTYAWRERGWWREERGTNALDTGAPWYEVYETSDGKWFSLGAMEPRFYAILVKGLGLDGEDLPDQNDRSGWPALKKRFADVIASKTRAEWTEHFGGSDACAAPVQSPVEAFDDPHLKARGTFVEVGGVLQPGAVPRFDRTPAQVRSAATADGVGTDETLAGWGIDQERIDRLRAAGALD